MRNLSSAQRATALGYYLPCIPVDVADHRQAMGIFGRISFTWHSSYACGICCLAS